MRYKDVQTGQTFFFEDNYSYPKRKTPHGHLDIRDGVTGYMPDDIPVVTLAEISTLRAELAASKEREAKLRNLLEQTHGELQRIAATGQKVDQGLLIETRRALESHE